jgi:tripartite-type tricarboxylate transporter receptor subunit TctC
MPQLPDIPTFEELGYKMFPRIARGAMAPKAMPEAMQKVLEKAFLETTSQPEFKTKMETAGFVPQVMGIADSRKFLEEEAIVITQLAREFDLKK